MRVNCREQIANPAEPVNGQDERRKCAAIPRSRSITRPQATDFAQQKRLLQKAAFGGRTKWCVTSVLPQAKPWTGRALPDRSGKIRGPAKSKILWGT